MTDVTIRGAGVFGLSIAWACLQRGARVRVVDPNGVAAGASGGIVGALAPHVPENWNDKKGFQLDSLLAAAGFWAKVAEVSGQDPGYARLGRLQPIADKAALTLAQHRAETARKLWPEGVAWAVVPAAEHEWRPLSPTGWLIHDTLSARIHPRRACGALAAAIRNKGGDIVADAPDQGQVVWCTGVADLIAMNQTVPRVVGNGVKGQAALMQMDRAALPQLFADTVHVVPHADGTIAIGSTSERDYDDPTQTDAQLDAVIARARAAVPALIDAPVIYRWAGLRPRSRSRAPMLGQHPLYPGQFIANGGFKIGFGMAPKVAQVMANLVLDGVDTIPTDFQPAASY